MHTVILASRSPRRSQLLKLANIPFKAGLPVDDEKYPAGLSPEEIPIYIARKKARSVRNGLSAEDPPASDIPILSADTIVVLGNEIIGKPAGREEAIATLEKLSGKIHRVITGVVIIYRDAEVAFAEVTEVIFHTLATDQIEHYVDTYHPFDKAGAYAIQEWIGAVGIKSIRGDFYNVMGLPISRVVMELQKIKS